MPQASFVGSDPQIAGSCKSKAQAVEQQTPQHAICIPMCMHARGVLPPACLIYQMRIHANVRSVSCTGREHVDSTCCKAQLVLHTSAAMPVVGIASMC